MIVIDCKVAAETVSANVFEVTPLCAAAMLLDPMAAPMASPLALIVTAVVFDEVQVAEFVRFCVVPSLNVPIAEN